MVEFRVAYADGSIVRGRTREDWCAFPDTGVQGVACFPREMPRRWTGVEDRDLWTGENTYQVKDWPAKSGSLIADEDYDRIWRKLFYG